MRQTKPEIKTEKLSVEEVEAKIKSLIDDLDGESLAELLQTLQGESKVEYDEAEDNFVISTLIE